jgi:hypothetical protein
MKWKFGMVSAAAIPGVLLFANTASAAIVATSTISLDNLGDGSYATTVTGNGSPVNYSGSYADTSITTPGVGYQYSPPPVLEGSVTAGNVILANAAGTIAIADLYFAPAGSGDYIVDVLQADNSPVSSILALPGNASDIILESAYESWTFTPTSTQTGFVTALSNPPAGSPQEYNTTYDIVVPEPSGTGLFMGLGALMPAGLVFLKRKLAAQA